MTKGDELAWRLTRARSIAHSGATAADVTSLIDLAQKALRAQTGIGLKHRLETIEPRGEYAFAWLLGQGPAPNDRLHVTSSCARSSRILPRIILVMLRAISSQKYAR